MKKRRKVYSFNKTLKNKSGSQKVQAFTNTMSIFFLLCSPGGSTIRQRFALSGNGKKILQCYPGSRCWPGSPPQSNDLHVGQSL